MIQMLMTVFMMLMCVSCGGPRYVDYFPYHDDGVPKLKVAIVSLSDHPECGLGWNFSDEVSQGLYYELMNSGKLYALSADEIGPAWNQREQYDFFGTDTTYVNDFCGSDIVAAIELIEHSIVPYDPCTGAEMASRDCKNCSTLGILMRVRIKVIDIRCQTPRVLLYEIVKVCYPLNPGTRADCVCNITFGTPGYAKTQCGMAHQRMIRQLAGRVEEVARCAR